MDWYFEWVAYEIPHYRRNLRFNYRVEHPNGEFVFGFLENEIYGGVRVGILVACSNTVDGLQGVLNAAKSIRAPIYHFDEKTYREISDDIAHELALVK